MTEAEIRNLANRFFAAIEGGDPTGVEACYAPDAEIWHNYDRASQTRAENVEVLKGFVARSRSRHYTERDLKVYADGFSQQHLLVATSLGGAVLELPAALFCDVADGRITRLREYFDPASVAAWQAQPNFA
jgi:ketosteroid isomerase-like protein